MSLDTHVLPDAEAVAVAAADRIAAVLSAGGHVALAGGSSPARAYELVGERAGDWSTATLWFSDDRAVGPRHEHSNCLAATTALLDHLAEPSRPRMHRIEGELGAAAAADRYEALIRAELGAHPRFDLVLLGLGPDAHTASLFPGKPALEERERLVVAVPEAGLEPFVPRVTFTFALINAAHETLFLVAGEGKAAAVARAFGEPADASAPAAHVRPATLLLDEAAASGLQR